MSGAFTRECFADRIGHPRLHIDGLRESVVGRRGYSPTDLRAMNVHLGDPHGGFCGLAQFF
jgi:phytoene dehydrogenase-like protein